MDMDKLTERARAALQQAQTLAARKNHQQIAPEHILRVLLDDEDRIADNLIAAAGGQSGFVMTEVEKALAAIPQVQGGDGKLYLSQDTGKVLDSAQDAAKKAGDSFVTIERLLQALTIVPNTKSNDILRRAGVTAQKLNEAINSKIGRASCRERVFSSV